MERHWMEVHGPIPVNKWGQDHRTTLMYAETRAVDQGGRIDHRQMRMDRTYPTRLARGETIIGHTDWDCLRDAEALGYLKVVDEDRGYVEFTDKGYALVAKYRREKAERNKGKPSRAERRVA